MRRKTSPLTCTPRRNCRARESATVDLPDAEIPVIRTTGRTSVSSIVVLPGPLLDHPLTTIDQLADSVEMAGVDRRLGQHVKDDVAKVGEVTSPLLPQRVSLPRRGIERCTGDDRVGSFD